VAVLCCPDRAGVLIFYLHLFHNHPRPWKDSPMKSPRFLASVVGVVLTAAFAAAQQGDSGRRPPTPSYYPLQAGNRWHFRVTANGTNANFEMHIAAIEDMDGVKVGRVEFLVNGKTVATEHVGQTAKGVFRYRNNNMLLSSPVCLLKYPIKSGD